MTKITCSKARQIDMVYYLGSIGFQPLKIRGNEYWYLSPLRVEKTPSFKIDRRLNIWYDHGLGKGGDLIDFGKFYHRCSVSDLLSLLREPALVNSSSRLAFERQIKAGEKKEGTENRIIILDKRPLTEPSLIQYLNKRCVLLTTASPYCHEVDFSLYNKTYRAIGFPNNAGGFELRNENFKGSSAPKAITFIDNGANVATVFEGFFNFLSFFNSKHKEAGLTNFLVLNSLSFFERSRELMEKHNRIHLYLDRDSSGVQAAKAALKWEPKKYTDYSVLYDKHKDLNELLMKANEKHQQRIHRGRSL